MPAMLRRLIWIVASVGLLSTPQFAGTRTVSWNPSAGATGYKLHYGTQPGDYSTTVNVGNKTQHVLPNLDDCITWYFAVSAYNTAGESGLSVEVDWLTPLSVSSATPNVPGQPVMQGQQFVLSVAGAGFVPGATLGVDHLEWTCPSGLAAGACAALLDALRNTVRLQNPSVTCNKILVLATIEPILDGDQPALVGSYKLTVTNPDAKAATKQQAFQVLKDPSRFDINRSAAATVDRLDGKDRIWLERLFGSCSTPGLGSTPCAIVTDYDPDYDFDGDGWVDGTDLADIASNFGSCWDGAAWKASACK